MGSIWSFGHHFTNSTREQCPDRNRQCRKTCVMGDGTPLPRGPQARPQAHSIQACNKLSDHDCFCFGFKSISESHQSSLGFPV